MIFTNSASNVTAGENPYRNQLLQAQICECFDTQKWRSLLAVSFSVKQGVREHGYMFYGDQETYTKAFERFIRRLNRAVHGNATRRFDKRLRVLAVVEKDRDGRWHIHAAIEPPEHMSEQQFRREILRIWPRKISGRIERTRSSSTLTRVGSITSSSSGKSRVSRGGQNSIDWYSFYNPPVDG